MDIALCFTSQLQFFSLLCCPMRICVHYQKWHEDSFHWNRLLQSYSSLPCPGNLVINVFILSIYSFYCHYKCYFFQIDPLESSFRDSVFGVSVSTSVVPFADFIFQCCRSCYANLSTYMSSPIKESRLIGYNEL